MYVCLVFGGAVGCLGAIFGELLLRRPLFGGHGEIDTIAKIWKLCGRLIWNLVEEDAHFVGV